MKLIILKNKQVFVVQPLTLILAFQTKKSSWSLPVCIQAFKQSPPLCSVYLCSPCGPIRLKLDSPQNLEGSHAQELLLLGGVWD